MAGRFARPFFGPGCKVAAQERRSHSPTYPIWRNDLPAKKVARQSVKRETRNRSVRTATRTILSTAVRSIESGDAAVAEKAVLVAISSLDRAVQKGILHKNTASRRKSRLSIKLNRLQAGSDASNSEETPVAAAPRRRASSSGGRQTRGRSS